MVVYDQPFCPAFEQGIPLSQPARFCRVGAQTCDVPAGTSFDALFHGHRVEKCVRVEEPICTLNLPGNKSLDILAHGTQKENESDNRPQRITVRELVREDEDVIGTGKPLCQYGERNSGHVSPSPGCSFSSLASSSATRVPLTNPPS